MKKNPSMKQRIYRIVYAVICSSLAIWAAFFGETYFIKEETKKADAAYEALAYIKAVESQYFRYLAHFRAFLINPTDKQQKEDQEAAHGKAKEFRAKAIALLSNEKVTELLKVIDEDNQKLDAIEERIFAAIESGDKSAVDKIYKSEHQVVFNQLLEKVDMLSKEYNRMHDQAALKEDQMTSIGHLVLVLVLLVSGLVTTVYVLRLAKSLSQHFEQIAGELLTTAQSVKTSSISVTSASQILSEATTEQAAAIEETVSSMEEMSSMLAQTAQNTETTLTVAEEGQREGERGKTVLNKMLTAMDEIHASNERLESIVKLIEEIKTKTKVINDIVFETRLLSFNASIEAARAGAHGKGFAVVAEEVGKLATMSGKAAEEIRSLLESSTTEVSNVVRGTQERVNAGREVSQDCQSVFESMSTSLQKIGEAVRMITAATKEQESGVRQTNQAMSEMDQVTQRNSGNAETLATQATELSSGATSLMGSIEHLQEIIFGGSSAVTPAAKLADLSAKVKSLKKEEKWVEPTPSSSAPEAEKLVPLEPAKPAKPAAADLLPLTSKVSEADRSDSRWKAS